MLAPRRLTFAPGMLGIDYETDGFEPHLGCKPFLVGAIDEKGKIVVVDVYRKRRGKVKGVLGNEALPAIQKEVEDRKRVKLAHNAKFEHRHSKALGWSPRGDWYCPMNMVVFLDEYSRLSLKELAKKHFGEKYEEEDKIKKWLAAEKRRRRKPWLDELRERMRRKHKRQRVSDIPEYQQLVKKGDGAPPEPTYRDFYESSNANARVMVRYLRKDLLNMLKLAFVFMPHIRKGWRKNFRVETKLVQRVSEMEDAGLPVDLALSEGFRDRYASMAKASLEAVFEEAGYEFNLNAPHQLLRALHDKGIDVPNTRKQTLGGLVSGSAEGGLRDQHRIVRELLEYRANTKVVSYFQKFLDVHVPHDDLEPHIARVHARFWQNGEDQGIKTGRFSITEPGLQTIPGGYRGTVGTRGKDCRRVVVPPSGDEVLVMIDYAQVEPRVLAYYTREPRLIDALMRGEDIYLAFVRIFFGSEIFEGWTEGCGREMPPMLKQRRSDAKTIILAITYGMGVDLMASNLGVPSPAAKGMREQCFREMPSMRELMRDCARDIYRMGYVEDLFGRHYHVPARRSYAGINAIIQGAAAHIMKRALVACGRVLDVWNRKHPNETPARMLLTVHDEILFHMRRSHVAGLIPLLKSAMESAAPEVDVPLVADASWSPTSWGDKQDWEPPKRKKAPPRVVRRGLSARRRRVVRRRSA